jgi:2-methylcitrate dehydratase PrpD
MTDAFAHRIGAFVDAALPASVLATARMRFLDYLGVTLAGARLLGESGRALAEAAGPGPSAALGMGRTCPALSAALLNGMSAHAAEMDDGHRGGGVHVGGTVFSALLAAYGRERFGTAAFLRGAVAGYEATVRCALALRPGHRRKGFHATGTCGTVGAAAAVAVALDFDAAQMKSALSAAASAAAGFLEMQEDDSGLKPFNMGQAAMAGLASADVGRAGFKPPHDAFGGPRGFLALLTDTPHPEALVDDRPALAIEEAYTKVHCACRHAHAAVDCALAIRGAEGFDPARIRSVEVETYAAAVNGHDHISVAGVNAAKMSIPFAVASALGTGRTGLDAYSGAAVEDASTIALASRVKVRATDEFTARAPAVRGAAVRVTFDDGREERVVTDHPKGEPENPLGEDGLNAKFAALARFGGLDGAHCDRIAEMLSGDGFNLNEVLEAVG